MIMKYGSKPLLVAVIFISLLLTGGCLQVTHTVTVLPDGSGKMEYRMAIGPVVAHNDPDKQINVIEVWQKSKGLACLADVRRGNDPKTGFSYVQFTAYFDDINKVSLGKNNAFSAKFKKTDTGGFEMNVRNGAIAEIAGEISNVNTPIPEEQKKIFDNLLLKEEYRLPGVIQKTTHLSFTNDRVATILVNKDDAINKAPVIKIAASKSRTITTGPASVSRKDIQAFKAEAKKALAAWPALKKKLEEEKRKAGGKKKKRRKNPNVPMVN